MKITGDETTHDVAPGLVDGRLAVIVDFDVFYSQSFRSVLALAVALTGDRGHAEDLVQDAFAAAATRWSKIGVYDDPTAWVRRVVLNKASSRWRRLGREARALKRLSPGERLIADELPVRDDRFWAAVRALPVQQAKAVALHYLEDMSVADVAIQLGCSPGAVKTHLSRARESLYIRLHQQYERLEEL